MKINKSSSAFTLIELLVVMAIIAILAGAALPVFTAVQERGKQTKDLSNGKQVVLALKQFALDNNGEFPQRIYAYGASYNDPAVVATPLVAGSSANDAFRWLIPTYTTSEDIFVVPSSLWSPSADNIVDTTAAGSTLIAGENGYAYVTALNDTSNPQMPLLADGFADPVTTPPQYSLNKAVKGGNWGGQRAVVIFVDGSGRVMSCDDKTNIAPFRPGRTYDEFDTANAAAATDPWLDGAAVPPNLVLNPL